MAYFESLLYMESSVMQITTYTMYYRYTKVSHLHNYFYAVLLLLVSTGLSL